MKEIRFENVVPHVFQHVTAWQSDVWHCQLTLKKGKCYLVEAESGQGKSTFCSYIGGWRNDYTGTIYFDDADVKSLKTNDWVDLRRRHISCLFQDLRLFPELTAMENIEIKNQLTDAKRREEIMSWFEKMGIADKKDVKVGQMSFGQQQRVAFMRALSQPFDFLLADEPISHLDDRNAAIMQQIMMDEAQKQGAGIIITSIGKHPDMKYDAIIKL